MDSDSKPLISGGNKLIAEIVIIILLVATLAASLVTYEAPRIKDIIEDEEFQIRFGDNVAASDTPQPNNEPAIAVDPNDPLHLVGACNDYGTPNGDA